MVWLNFNYFNEEKKYWMRADKRGSRLSILTWNSRNLNDLFDIVVNIVQWIKNVLQIRPKVDSVIPHALLLLYSRCYSY